MQKYRNFYFISLAVITALSAYPIYMGISTFSDFLTIGYIEQSDYPKYLIPYAPMCIAMILSAAVMPIFLRFCKKLSLLLTSAIGIGLFLALERFFEQIKVVIGYESVPVQSWQLGLCMATPEVLEAIGDPIYAENDPAFKVHFYIIAAVMILGVLGLLYGYSRLFLENKKELKRSLIAQTLSVTLFIALCVVACLTAFFRNGTLNISPLSAFLTGLFFVVFGMTFGIYTASFLVSKGKIGVILPAITASLMTLVMYIGELMLMDGKLFILGNGPFFAPLSPLPFSACDILLILAAGMLTALIACSLVKGKSKE